MKKIMFNASIFLLCISTQAQVVKCKDANGKIIYSDVACPSNATSSAINLSGGNITEDQAHSARESAENSSNTGGGENCSMLKNQARQTFDSFQENTNLKRWDVSFQSLQNLANSCASPEICGLIRTRIDHAQQRYSQDNTSYRGSQLNSVTALLASACRSGSARQVGRTAPAQTEAQSPAVPVNKGGSYYTKDEFGTVVRSDKCFHTKDVFGVSRRSAGCAR
ncbi:MAG: DUF4124 domain-containing protein [Rhodoferax sp.]|uniref:DUF4124 domain-containing protein n=1 Tax=Rhodoferax sp. TaxID=50421 RepID=UPI0017F3F0F5|nr:DUF4124 domain-containing protein [Rhodoferax sp.]NMM13192.1 DUF4124 domain-containing protein [Rhodoferax sp.]